MVGDSAGGGLAIAACVALISHSDGMTLNSDTMLPYGDHNK